jgi:hypothetical protein
MMCSAATHSGAKAATGTNAADEHPTVEQAAANSQPSAKPALFRAVA